MSDHKLVLTGPYPYFSSRDVYFGQCTCGNWESGKDSEPSIRHRHAQHAEAKDGPREEKAWENERWNRKL